MLSHEKAIMQLGRYLLDTQKHGIIYKPGIQSDASNAENGLSRTGYVIMYANSPILWVSRLQTEIALSTAEAKYIDLSQALCVVIPLITLLKEVYAVFPVHMKTPTFV